MNEQDIDAVIEKLKALRMKTAAEHLVRILERADAQNLPPLMIIEALIDIEEEMRRKNRILRRFKQSRLLEKPTIDQFDFHVHGLGKNFGSTVRIGTTTSSRTRLARWFCVSRSALKAAL